MIGSKLSLDVYLHNIKIAELSFIDDELQWQYSPELGKASYPVSPHLPLASDIPSLNVQRFLRNLLPEGNGLQQLLDCFRLSKENTFGLIRALGLDIPGALVMLPAKQALPQESYFRVINDAEIVQRLNSREAFNLIVWDNKPRLSVAGVQDKINVVVNEHNQLGFGEGQLCSTHILKFEKHKFSHLVLNEYITMQLAKQAGLVTAEVELKYYGDYKALLIKRFDRQFISMTEVKRRHLIDGCQALNLPPEYKYERNFGSGRDVAHIRDGASLSKLFEFAEQCINPALTKQQMLDWVLFNVVIFNYDAHGKNISFFVTQDGITLAPFYDLVNIKMYPDFEHEMAMALGDEFDGEVVNAYQLADFADSCKLSRSLVATRLGNLLEQLNRALESDLIDVAKTTQEEQYLIRYKAMIRQRCEHLFAQVGEITSMEL